MKSYTILLLTITSILGCLTSAVEDDLIRNVVLRGTKTLSVSDSTKIAWDDYYCTMQALMNKEECLRTQNPSDDQSCQFCTLVDDDSDEGLCLSPNQASKAQESLPGKVSCETNRDTIRTHPEKIESNDDITNCNLKGLDVSLCLDPSKVGGSNCIWCDVGLGGFCFPQYWQQSVSKFLDCSSNSSNEINQVSSWSFFSSSCYRLGTDHDSCVSMKDEGSDENCQWCDAYVFGFCLNPEEAESVGSLLTCGSDSWATTTVASSDLTATQ